AASCERLIGRLFSFFFCAPVPNSHHLVRTLTLGGDTVSVAAEPNFYQNYELLADEEVVAYARGGDVTALEYVINKYRNFVRAKARSYFLIGADREDIVQEGMIGLYKAIRDFRPDKLASFRAFAELCVTRQIITAIKTA